MGEERAKQIICNLLYQICNYTDIAEGTVSDYFDWLRVEVGITDEEIYELQLTDCFPYPSIKNPEDYLIKR